MFKCVECGADNSVGSVHCVNCGAKLDLENMAPEFHLEDKESAEVRAFVVRRCFLLCIWIVLFGTPLLSLIPPSAREVKQVEPNRARASATAFNYFYRGVRTGYSATEDDFTAVLKETFKDTITMPAYQWMSFEPKDVRVDIREDKKLVFVVKSTLFKGNLPFYSSIVIDPSVPNEVYAVSIGRLPLPEPLHGLVTGSLEKELMKKPDLKECLPKVQSINLENGVIALTRQR